MLGDIRKNVNHPFIKALLGTIIIVFIFFFGWSMRGTTKNEDAVAKVNGDAVSAEEYRSAYNNLLQLYSRITGQRLDQEKARSLGLDTRALDQIIDQRVLLQEADRRGMKVTDEELAGAIQRQGPFMDGNVFNRDKYNQALAGAGLTPARYEEMKRQELLIGKVEGAVKATAQLSEEEIVGGFKDNHTTLAVDYAEFDPENFTRQVLVTPEKLKEFHASEGEKFRVEEKRRARFAFFSANDYLAQIPVTDEEAKKEYAKTSFKYAQPAMVRARHILVRADGPADFAKAEAKARELREKISKGLDFATAARSSSDDDGTKANGGDLGFFPKNTLVPEFENAAFALKVGEVSQPVRTQYGYHLIKAEARTEERQRPFEEVKAEVVSAMKKDKAIDLAYKDADNALMDLEQKKSDWEALGKRHTVKSTGLLAAKERDNSIPPVRGFMEALFEISEAKVGQVMEGADGAYIISIAERRPAQVPPLDTIKADVEAKFRIVESRKLAKEAAARFATDAAAKGWNQALSTSPATKGASETFSKKGGQVVPLGSAPEAVKAIFEKPEIGRVVPGSFQLGEKNYVFRISAATAPDMATLEVEREKIKNELLPAKQNQTVESLLKTLRDGAKIEILAPELAKQSLPK